MRKSTLAKLLLPLGEVFQREISPALLEIYWQTLKNYPDALVMKALSSLLKTSKFFPKPAEIIECIEGSPDEKSLIAWNTLMEAIRLHGSYSSVKFVDKVLSKVVEDLGGWVKLCSTNLRDLDNLRSLFIKYYKLYSTYKQGIEGPEVHAGLIELENRRSGFLEDIPEAEVVGDVIEHPALNSLPKPC